MRLDREPSRLREKGSLRKSCWNLILAAAGVGGLILLYILYGLSPVASKSSAREVAVAIPPQATARQVGQLMKQSEVVRNPVLFYLYARFRGLDSQIKAGEYQISNSLSTPEVLQEMVDGRLAVQSFTIPEGFTTAQVADLLVSRGFVDRENFFMTLGNEPFTYSFTESLPQGDRRLEGYLFPDTYQVTRGLSERSIIDLMLRRFEVEMDELDYPARAEKAGLTLHQAVTIASMVEREARVDQERPLISGVIHNRIKRSIPLQIDATVQYALGANKPKLYYKDLEIDSPYNTYRVNGLPPGPIAMPGRSSLEAAVNPAQTEYLYYVAKPDGSHAFATTLADHNLNKERYQP